MSLFDFGSPIFCFDSCFDARPRPCRRCKHRKRDGPSLPRPVLYSPQHQRGGILFLAGMRWIAGKLDQKRDTPQE